VLLVPEEGHDAPVEEQQHGGSVKGEAEGGLAEARGVDPLEIDARSDTLAGQPPSANGSSRSRVREAIKPPHSLPPVASTRVWMRWAYICFLFAALYSVLAWINRLQVLAIRPLVSDIASQVAIGSDTAISARIVAVHNGLDLITEMYSAVQGAFPDSSSGNASSALLTPGMAATFLCAALNARASAEAPLMQEVIMFRQNSSSTSVAFERCSRLSTNWGDDPQQSSTSIHAAVGVLSAEEFTFEFGEAHFIQPSSPWSKVQVVNGSLSMMWQRHVPSASTIGFTLQGRLSLTPLRHLLSQTMETLRLNSLRESNRQFSGTLYEGAVMLVDGEPSNTIAEARAVAISDRQISLTRAIPGTDGRGRVTLQGSQSWISAWLDAYPSVQATTLDKAIDPNEHAASHTVARGLNILTFNTSRVEWEASNLTVSTNLYEHTPLVTWRADRASGWREDVVIIALASITAENISFAPPWWVLVSLPQSLYRYNWTRSAENLFVMVLALLLVTCYVASVVATDTLDELLAYAAMPTARVLDRDSFARAASSGFGFQDDEQSGTDSRSHDSDALMRGSLSLELLKDVAKLPADHLELCLDALKPSVWAAVDAIHRLGELHPDCASIRSPRCINNRIVESLTEPTDGSISRRATSIPTRSLANSRTFGDFVLHVLERSSSTVRRQELRAGRKRWRRQMKRQLQGDEDTAGTAAEDEVAYPSLSTVLAIVRKEGAPEYIRQTDEIVQVASLRQSHYREALRRTVEVTSSASTAEPTKFERMMARRYIDLAAAGYDIVELLAMEQDLQVVRIRIHLLQNSPLWKVMVYVAILVHVLLPIVAETPDVCGQSTADFLGLACVVVHCLDCLLELAWGGLWSKHGQLRTRLLARCILVVVILGDWMLQYMLQYSAEGIALKCLSYTIPLRSPLAIVRSRTASAALRKFAFSINRNAQMFVVWVAMLALNAVLGTLLFASNAADGYFNNIVQSAITMFIFMLGAENYSSLFWPIMNTPQEQFPQPTWLHSLLYRAFFWLTGLLLLFVLNAAVIAAFERDFTEQHRAHCYKLRLQRRLGILAAFVVLDKSQTNDLSPNEVCRCCVSLCLYNTCLPACFMR